MANKSPAKKTQKSKPKKDPAYYPVENRILFEAQTGTGLQIAEMNRGLSGINRRLYRQNRVYRLKVDLIGEDPKRVEVFRLKNSFMLHQGYKLAMEEWNKSYKEARDVTRDASVGRWRDFRIATTSYLGDSILNPLQLAPAGPKVMATPVVIDEFQNSLSYTTAGAARDFGLREDSNTYGILHEWDKKGNVAADPSSATTEAAYVDLTADLVDAEVENLQIDGNLPPYDADSSFPEAMLEYVGTIYQDSDGNSKKSTGYFDAPLGAVYLWGIGSNLANMYAAMSPQDKVYAFQLTAQKGDYKGVKAHEFVDVTKLEE